VELDSLRTWNLLRSVAGYSLSYFIIFIMNLTLYFNLLVRRNQFFQYFVHHIKSRASIARKKNFFFNNYDLSSKKKYKIFFLIFNESLSEYRVNICCVEFGRKGTRVEHQ